MPYLTDKFQYNNKLYVVTWIPGKSYLGYSPITQAYGFCFDRDGKLLVIESADFKTWHIPGGTIEDGETPEETLIREIQEEANVEVKDVEYLGAQVSECEEEKVYQLRFVCKVDKVNPRKVDPATGVVIRRRFINPSKFADVSGWGEIGQDMADRAVRKLEN